MFGLHVQACSPFTNVATPGDGNDNDCDGEIDEDTCTATSTTGNDCAPNAPVDGVWSDWSEWSACASSSDTRNRVRLCSDPRPQYGGRTCSGDSTQSESCPSNCVEVDGGWSSWSEWSACDESSCVERRVRSCTSPLPECGGATCEGDAEDTDSCCSELGPFLKLMT